jgi:hypothetical protein
VEEAGDMTTTPRRTAQELSAMTKEQILAYFEADGDMSDVLANATPSSPPSGPMPDRLPDEDEVLPVTSVRIRASALDELDKLGGRDGRSRLIRQAIDEFLARRGRAA